MRRCIQKRFNIIQMAPRLTSTFAENSLRQLFWFHERRLAMTELAKTLSISRVIAIN